MKKLEDAGRYGDTLIAHINPLEARLLKLFGGSGTTNPETGFLEFYGFGGGDSDPGGMDGADDSYGGDSDPGGMDGADDAYGGDSDPGGMDSADDSYGGDSDPGGMDGASVSYSEPRDDRQTSPQSDPKPTGIEGLTTYSTAKGANVGSASSMFDFGLSSDDADAYGDALDVIGDAYTSFFGGKNSGRQVSDTFYYGYTDPNRPSKSENGYHTLRRIDYNYADASNFFDGLKDFFDPGLNLGLDGLSIDPKTGNYTADDDNFMGSNAAGLLGLGLSAINPLLGAGYGGARTAVTGDLMPGKLGDILGVNEFGDDVLNYFADFDFSEGGYNPRGDAGGPDKVNWDGVFGGDGNEPASRSNTSVSTMAPQYQVQSETSEDEDRINFPNLLLDYNGDSNTNYTGQVKDRDTGLMRWANTNLTLWNQDLKRSNRRDGFGNVIQT